MRSSFVAEDTIAAIATPSGEGAIGIVRLSGKESIPIAASLLTLANGESLLSSLPRTAHLAVFHQNGSRIDQVIVTNFKAPNSFTGEDMIEIACHGGSSVLKQILALLIQVGARAAEPGEFSQRAFLNGKMDLVQAEAVADLIQAKTSESSQAAFSNLEGRLSKEIKKIRETLLKVMASLEVAVDHTDDTSVGTSLTLAQIKNDLSHESDKIDQLIMSYASGRLLREGVKIAIAGRPNVGKSSLLNSLLSSERAIVSPHPGTTRDTVEEAFDLMGIPAVLIDTAGLRSHTQDPIEEIGMQRTQRAIEESDLTILVFDSSFPFIGEDEKVARLTQGKKTVIVFNKMDLPQKVETSKVRQFFPEAPLVPISVLKNEGISELLQALKNQLPNISKNEESSTPSAMVTSVRHRDCLLRASENLKKAQQVIVDEGPEECVSLEIREALENLGEMTGESVTEEILDKIFSSFCIGK